MHAMPGRAQGPADRRHDDRLVLRRNGDEYTCGEILDPKNGKVYKSKLSLHEGGRKLEVRGYVGVPMFGRSQVWLRQD